MRIIDGHVHVGNNKKTNFYTLTDAWRDLHSAGAHGACIFAFPEDVYRSVDSKQSRIRANRYVLKVSKTSENIYPFYFVWNDYIIPENLEEYSGIKWHRHADESRYDYSDPKCLEMLERINELRIPVLLEEEYENTLLFVDRNPELDVIIPHMGKANGGTERMKVFFHNPKIRFDTSVAPLNSIRYILRNVGPERVIFGSDVSGTSMPFFNFPEVELEKVLKLGLDDERMQLILADNMERLVNGSI